MEISVSVQTFSFLCAMLFGVVTGALYDVFRIIRVAFPIGKVAVFIEDLLYLFAAGILTFIYILKFNSGEIRIYIMLGIILGFTAYYCTVGRIVIGSARLIVNIIKKVLTFIFGILFIPIKKICSLFKLIFRKINKKTKKIQKKSSNLFHFLKKKYNICLYSLKQKAVKKKGGKNGGKKKKQNHSHGDFLRDSSHFNHFNDGFR